jgi:peptidoglycan hydrolase-like protein with peptidoglycan-binding domain
MTSRLPVTAIFPISAFSRSDLLTLQDLLLKARFPPGPLDGLYGPRTLEAWASFKESVNLHDPDQIELIGPSSYQALVKASRSNTGVIHDFSTKAGTIAAIRWECNAHGLIHRNQQAYVLATTEWETARTFRPLEEYGKGRGRTYGRPDPQTGKTYYGRGFPQLTWKSNYERYGKILGIDLVNKPELALNPNVSLFILVHGMRHGKFTGRSLPEFVNATKSDFINARRVVNGMDKASTIAAIARKYL